MDAFSVIGCEYQGFQCQGAAAVGATDGENPGSSPPDWNKLVRNMRIARMPGAGTAAGVARPVAAVPSTDADKYKVREGSMAYVHIAATATVCRGMIRTRSEHSGI